MSTHQDTGRKIESTTPNKKAMNIQAAGGKMANKDTIQARAAYPSPAKTPPAKSPTLFHEDGGFEEDEETPSHGSGTNYKDFTLYPERSSEYDSYDFFVDIEESVQEHHGSIFSYDGTAREAPAKLQNGSRLRYDPVRGENKSNVAINNTVYEAIEDYETPSYSNYSMTSADDYILTPLGTWEYTFERHESLAYRFEQPPYSTRQGIKN